MANVSEFLNVIKNAIYGRDMRAAIHDSIEELDNSKQDKLIFDYAPTKGSQNPVISGALYDRFNGIDGKISDVEEKK